MSKGWTARSSIQMRQKPSVPRTMTRIHPYLTLKCWAGCKEQDILAAIGMSMDDLLDAPVRVQEYVYRGESERVVKQKVRYDPKTFRWEYWDFESNRFVSKPPNGVDLPLIYNLPEVVAALDQSKLVFVVEGEKDSDNLMRLGGAQDLDELANAFEPSTASKVARLDFVATTIGAAITNSNSEELDAFYALEEYDKIVIIPDNDKAGEKHVRNLTNWLLARGCKVKIVRLEEDGIKDVSDWIAKGGTEKELLKLVESAKCAERFEHPLEYIRKRYSLVMAGGKTVALNVNALQQGKLETQSHDTFMDGDGSKPMERVVNTRKGVEVKEVKAGTVWWKQEASTGIRRLVYKPGEGETKGEFNLWRGWGVEPRETWSCELLKTHLRDIVCRGKS